jgi:2-amino-4-hydroxy-6-hydroxymethyldihydropteridine diphosphokinase
VSETVRRAFLGLGTNLGDRRRHLETAVGNMPELVRVSSVYETEPVGGPEQGAFLNIVVELATTKEPFELLELCRSLEVAAGRERRVRWGPRTLDVDVLWIDGVTVDTPELRVPHPRMHQRNFVVVPLLELAPDLAAPLSDLGFDPDTAFGAVASLGVL